MFLKVIFLVAHILLGVNMETLFPKPKTAITVSPVENLEYRVAFDLGSGNLKMQAAWIDPGSGRIAKVAETESATIAVRDSLDRDPNGNIPDVIVTQLISSLRAMQQKAEEKGHVSKYVGGATEAYRTAKNGQEVLDRIERELGISMVLLTQDEEAVLGYRSLQAEGLLTDHPDALIWENGGGSTQISKTTYKDFHSFNLSIGKVAMKNYLLQKLQGKDAGKSPNPINREDAEQAILWAKEQFQDAPSWAHEKGVVMGIGAMFPNVQKGLGKMEFTKQELRELIDVRIGKLDEELSPDRDPNTPYILSDLLFLYGAMDALGIEMVQCPKMKGPGSTSGLLISI